MSLRDELNAANPNRMDPIFHDVGLGDLMCLVINGLADTESGVTVTTNVATLANQPSTLLRVNATTATTTGEKKILKGPITGANAVVPKTGEAVWDGAKKVLFATVDVVTAAKFCYPTAATVTPGVLKRDLGESDTNP